MQAHHILWSTILGYIGVAVTISILTSLWIRYHLKRPDILPSVILKKTLKKKVLTLKKHKKDDK